VGISVAAQHPAVNRGVDDEYLLERRTEPVRVEFWVDNILLDLDADPASAAHDEIDRREDKIPAPDDHPTSSPG
jgi:hypothetical protein